MSSACASNGALAGQPRSRARRVISRSFERGAGSLPSPASPAASAVTDSNSAGRNPAGTTRQASSLSRVRCPTHSVCVPLQCGMSVMSSQLQLAPRSTEPLNPAASNGFELAGGAPK